MRIAVRASKQQQEEWQNKNAVVTAIIHFVDAGENLSNIEADVYFDLLFDRNDIATLVINKPVFVNAVIELLTELPPNYMRINAWNGFLQREVMEIVTSEQNKPFAGEVMEALGWKYIFSPDIRGMIVLRSISMIINEAYFALEDKVSSKTEIDTAMRLGTNYPFGPFEWSQKIGLKNIYELLKILSVEDHHYIAASLLEQEALTTTTI